MQVVREDVRRMFGTCLLVSIAEFVLIHLSNLFVFVPFVLGPFIIGWQAAMPYAYFHGARGKAALDASFAALRSGKMFFRVALALCLVRSALRAPRFWCFVHAHPFVWCCSHHFDRGVRRLLAAAWSATVVTCFRQSAAGAAAVTSRRVRTGLLP
jgi:hypothetical protein